MDASLRWHDEEGVISLSVKSQLYIMYIIGLIDD